MENIKADFFKQNIHNGQNYLADKPAVIDFYADWCGPCKMITPALQQLSKEYEGKVSFYKINVDDEPELAQTWGISSIPTIMFFNSKGESIVKLGALPKNEIKKIIENII